MYDPTVFENLKVAFENQLYDLDTIEGEITMLGRSDVMDFAILSRKLAIRFALVEHQAVTAEIILEASLTDLADELLENPGKNPSCSLTLRFHKRVQDVAEQCQRIDEALNEIWENEAEVAQTLHFTYGEAASSYLDVIEVRFKKINEDNMREIPDFLQSVLIALGVLNGI